MPFCPKLNIAPQIRLSITFSLLIQIEWKQALSLSKNYITLECKKQNEFLVLS